MLFFSHILSGPVAVILLLLWDGAGFCPIPFGSGAAVPLTLSFWAVLPSLFFLGGAAFSSSFFWIVLPFFSPFSSLLELGSCFRSYFVKIMKLILTILIEMDALMI